MLQQPYCRAWRPGTSDRYCLDRSYASDFHDLCNEYARLENKLRNLLAHFGTSDSALKSGGKRVYALLREVRYELDHNFAQILKANRYSGRRRDWTWDDFNKLEPLLHMSEYEVSLPPCSTYPARLRPFLSWEREQPEWYRGNYRLFIAEKETYENATLEHALNMLAGLYCVLYAQFGTNLAVALRPRTRKEGEGYFTAQSIFSVKPPCFSPEEQYGFQWEAIKKKKGQCVPFFS